jgi:hypothetical protein
MIHWQWTSFEDYSFPYITGNGFSVQCKYIWNYDGYKINPNKDNNWVFIKTDYIKEFFDSIKLDISFFVFTHNSDFPITEEHLRFLDDPRVIVWFAENANVYHPKLKSIPIGIASAGYIHGDISILNRIRSEENEKTNMVYANFSVNTSKNSMERQKCLEQTGITLIADVNGGWNGYEGGYKVPDTFEGYLRSLSKSYFCISPKGNGIDCHRTWESLYVKTIPIVTRSMVVEEHKYMPIIILDDWSEFKNISFSKELYDKTWNGFNIEELYLHNYMKRIMREIN